MKPYYDHNGITIYNGDCLKIMPDILDGSIDMVMTDPPYGTTACAWDSIIPFEPMWEQLKRIIKKNGAIVLTASQPFTTALISSNMGMFKYEWIWDKIQGANFMNLKNRPFKTQEQVLVFSKMANFTFNPIKTLRSPSSLKRDPIGGKGRIIKHNNKVEHYNCKASGTTVLDNMGMKHPIDIIQFPVVTKGRYKIKHPTKKPVGLMEYLIKTYTNEGETVLDFAMGSGTTLVAGKKLGRKATGIEIEEKYCEIGAKRLAQEAIPLG